MSGSIVFDAFLFIVTITCFCCNHQGALRGKLKAIPYAFAALARVVLAMRSDPAAGGGGGAEDHRAQISHAPSGLPANPVTVSSTNHVLPSEAVHHHGPTENVSSYKNFVGSGYVSTRPAGSGNGNHGIAGIEVSAAADLGIEVEFDCLDFLSAQRRAAVEPSTYDVYDQCFTTSTSCGSGAPSSRSRSRGSDAGTKVSALTKTGQIGPQASIGQGDAPVTRLYVQPDRSLGGTPSCWISMLPTVHTVDSFAYRKDMIGDEVPNWGSLLDPRWQGLALVNEPAIGGFDAILALQASGALSFETFGQLSTGKIDALLDHLSRKRDTGHFFGFWKTAVGGGQLGGGRQDMDPEHLVAGHDHIAAPRHRRRGGGAARRLSRLAWRALPVAAS